MRRDTCIAFMSTYPPRECGIATFTQDLFMAAKKEFSPRFNSKIIAMDNGYSENIKYSKEVIFRVNERCLDDYIKVARKINRKRSIKLVSIQHEFGIFGGKYLNYLSAFLETIKKPVVITLHSVVPNPSDNIRNIIQYLAKKSNCLVVMNKLAIEILKKDYGIKDAKIEVIHHGIHKVSYEQSIVVKRRLGYENKILLASFGLIGGGKNYEDIIKGMPAVVKKFPNVLYLIIGKTHPGILMCEGEKYRNNLKKLIKKLKLNKNVKFINKYLLVPELLEHLKANDIFLSSGRGLHQITSGTLACAMGCGRPTISIPFLHAQEAVTKDRGILVGIGDSKAYSEAIIKLLSNPKLRESMGKNAYDYTRQMVWNNVAKSYLEVFQKYM